ncbi:MAG: trigger factor [Cyanobacteria bacterium P01_F01_bin.150]
MKVTQEKLPASQLGLEIEIESDVSKKAYEKTLREYTQKANIPGFRKGKVPRQVLIQRFGASRIKATVLEKLINDSLEAAIKQEKIEALGNLQLRSSFEELVSQFKPGETLKVSASVDVPPEVQLEGYRGQSFQAEEVKFDEGKVDSIIEDQRNRVATLIPIEERPAQLGDTAIVDFSGVLTEEKDENGEAKPIPGGSADGFQLELEEGQFIPGFITGIVGMSPGEEKEVPATFPENYPQADMAGKAALFSVKLNELKEKDLPDLDDDFAQDVSEFETLAELKDSLTTRLKNEAEQKTKENQASVLFGKLIEIVEVDPPESMISQQVDLLVNQTAMQLQQQGLDIKKVLTKELLDNMRQNARPEALTQLKQRLAVEELAQRESIEASEEAVDAKVDEFLANYGDRDVDMGRLRNILAEELVEEKVLDWLIENNTVELVPEGTLATEEENGDASEDATSTDDKDSVDEAESV